MNNIKYVHFSVTLLAVAAMVLPYGGVLRFMSSPESDVSSATYETFSYFDPMLYGNGNFGPFLAAIVSALFLVFLTITLFCRESRAVHITMIVMSGAALLFSLLPLLMYGAKYFTMTACMISFLLGCSLVMSVQRLTGKSFSDESEET